MLSILSGLPDKWSVTKGWRALLADAWGVDAVLLRRVFETFIISGFVMERKVRRDKGVSQKEKRRLAFIEEHGEEGAAAFLMGDGSPGLEGEPPHKQPRLEEMPEEYVMEEPLPSESAQLNGEYEALANADPDIQMHMLQEAAIEPTPVELSSAQETEMEPPPETMEECPLAETLLGMVVPANNTATDTLML